MLVDRTTLADLEVLVARDGSEGILGLVDQTKTARGHQALRRRLEQPLSSVEEIREVQAALSSLSMSSVLPFLDEKLLAGAERYVLSNVVVIGREGRLRARLEEAWLRIRYRPLLRELIEGQAALRILVDFVRRLLPSLTGEGAPNLLAEYGGQIQRIFDRVESALRSSPILHSDRILRGSLRKEVLELLDLLGELDALRSMGVAGKDRGWSTPELVDSSEFLLEAKGAFHPFVEAAVRNPIHLSQAESVIFLTGPNMAGKTTYLKTVGLLVLLAQVGMDVPAETARLAPVEVVFTSLHPTDNLRAGISYFFAEILRVKEAAEILASDHRALVLFDEVFKGTNVKDALDASAQVIEGFSGTERGAAIFASHLSELHEVLQGVPSIRFFRFEGDVSGDVPDFSFELREGVSNKRLGMFLLEQAQVPDLIAKIRRRFPT